MIQRNVTASGTSTIEMMRRGIGGKVGAFSSNKCGTAAIAYALLASLIALAMTPAVDMVGGKTASLFSDITASFDVASPSEPAAPKKEKKAKKDKKAKKS